MSRIGKQPIVIFNTVTVSLNHEVIIVKGPKGKLLLPIPKSIGIIINNNKIILSKLNNYKKTKQLYGLYRTLINNMIIGVYQGFSKHLIIQGVGYRAQVHDKNLILNVGYSHPVLIKPPYGITIQINNSTGITVSGADKIVVGETAAKIRSVRPPEPYKGKGIRYQKEFIKKKVGKTGK